MTWLFGNWELVLQLTLQHLKLSVPPIVLGLVIAIPLGWLAYRFRLTRGVILTVVGLLYTIPSLALLVILPTALGIRITSELNLIIGLTIYAIAILARSIADALAAVEPEVRLSATAMGFGAWRRFWQVELPLAGPVILAGLRVAAVSTVSLVTVGILVGVSNQLGYLFTNGLQRRIMVEVLTGLVMVVLVAFVIDRILVLIGRILMPWNRVTGGAKVRRALRRQAVSTP